MTWLIFDAGTSGVKAALVDDSGRILRSHVEPYPTDIGAGSVVEQNAADWWNAALTASRALSADFAAVEAIAVTGQMQDLLLLDADSNPIRPAILYSDLRAQSEADEVIARVGRDHLRDLTANDQGADSLWAKILWVQRHQPEIFASARAILFSPADYYALKLTGNAATDTTTASTTGLMDMQTRTWLEPSIFGFKALPLPTLVAGGAQVGTLMQSAADLLGLKSGLSVYHAPGDAGAATIGAGSGEAGQVYGYLGTSGWIAFTSAQRGSPDQGVFTLAHPHADHYIPIAPLLTAGGNLDWAHTLFHTDAANDYTNSVSEALSRPISNLLYLPYLNGERTPFTDPLARGAFIGLNPSTERADVMRAVLEGVVYAYRHALDALLLEKPASLTLTGGGTRSEGWCQFFADILAIPIRIAADAENVGIRGALLSVQVAAGIRPNYAPDGFFPIRATLPPNPAHFLRYDQKYVLFRAAYPALKPIFAQQK